MIGRPNEHLTPGWLRRTGRPQGACRLFVLLLGWIGSSCGSGVAVNEGEMCRTLSSSSDRIVAGDVAPYVLCGRLCLANLDGDSKYQACRGRVLLSYDQRDQALVGFSGTEAVCLRVQGLASPEGTPIHRLVGVSDGGSKFASQLAWFKSSESNVTEVQPLERSEEEPE